MSESGRGEFNPDDFLNSFRKTAVGVLMSPQAFFNAMQREGGFRSPFLFLLTCLMIHTLIVALIHKTLSPLLPNLLFGLFFPFITAGFLTIVLTQVFKGQGSFEAAFRVNAYAGAIKLLSWFPVAGLLLEFYRIYVITIGMSTVFGTEPWKALVALLVIVGLYVALLPELAPILGGPGSGH